MNDNEGETQEIALPMPIKNPNSYTASKSIRQGEPRFSYANPFFLNGIRSLTAHAT